MPFRLRVGVTGHRTLSDEGALEEAVVAAVERIRALVPGPRLSPAARTSVVFTVVSPIAEGADRLVARVLLNHFDADLEVPLPLAVDDYRQDFETEASRREFDELLARATTHSQAPPTRTRNEAYELAGRYVVDRCDVLIALWDGEESRGRVAPPTSWSTRAAMPCRCS